MMDFLRQYSAVLAKDVLVEARTRDVIYPMALFSFLMVVIFSFAFLSDPARARDYGPGIVWVTVLFASTVGLNRLFDRERENECLWAMLLSPAGPKAIFTAKVTGHVLFTMLMEVLTVPMVILFFDLRIEAWGPFVGSLVLGTVGLSLVGTLFSAMLMNARMKEVLLPLVTYPILVPVVIAGVKLTAVALGSASPAEGSDWLGFLLGFDMIFAVVTLHLFERMVRA